MAIIQELESYVQSYPAGMDTVTDVSLSQNENGRQLRFKIIGVTIPAGSVATISGTKPDGAVYSKAGTIEGSDTVIFDEDVQMTAVFGTWYAKIRIINSGNTIASARVRFIIDKDPVDAGSVPSDSQLDGIIAEMEAYVEEARSVAYGSPLTASTAAAMTDQTKVYVYTGTETGYTAGHWYFWNGTEWHDGGVYNAVAVQTDKTLSVADKAADGKATGEALEHRIPVYSEDDYTTDSTPYLYRQTGGGVAVGTREIDEVVGGSVGWNQLCNGSSVTVTSGHKYYMVKGGTKSIGASTGSAITGLTSGTDIVTDLTLLLGSTIADYIYSLETATAGAGVAKLKEWGFFAEDYYAYDAGSLQSVTGVSAHIMRDADDNIVGNYPLDDSLTLRGIPKLDSNKLYYDGDVYQADGTVNRRFGVYTFTGSETWAAWGQAYYTTCLPVNGNTNKTVAANIFNTVGLPSAANGDMYSADVESMGQFNKNIYVNKTFYQNSLAKLTGTSVVYELATPTTETADPYASVQICAEGGTEEYITTGIVPVGHNTKYPADLAGKLDSIPALPTTAGNYRLKVTVTDGTPSYEWVSA